MAQSFYVRLLTLVDDYGRYEAKPRLLQSHAFPLSDDVTTEEVLQLCSEVSDAGLVLFYKAGGKLFLQITNWKERPRTESKFPPFASNCEQMFASASNCLPISQQLLSQETATASN